MSKGSLTDSDGMVLGTLVCLCAMLGLAPIAATTTLALLFADPSRWVESLNPIAILAMAIFGVFTVPLWPTYIPAVIITPFVMRWLSRQSVFRKMTLPAVIVASMPIGAFVGFVIFLPLLGPDLGVLWWKWAAAGIVSGSITFPVIAAIHRKWFSGVPGAAHNPPPLPPVLTGITNGQD